MLRPAPLLVFLPLVFAASSPWAGASAWAEPEARVLDLPREGFSVNALPGWTVAQPQDALLHLRLRAASVWVRRDAGKADDLAGRLKDLAIKQAPEGAASAPTTWTVTAAGEGARIQFDQGGQRHGFGLVSQPRGLRLEVEWALPAADAELVASVEALLASLNVTPYANPRRFVDLVAGWSIDVPHGWSRLLDAEGRTLFRSDEQPPTLIAVRRAPEDPAAFDQEGRALWTKALRLPVVAEPATALPALPALPEGATRFATRQFLAGAEDGARPGYATTQERSGSWISNVTPEAARESALEAASAVVSFRAPADAGPRVGPQGPPVVLLGEPQPFANATAPKVTFRLPAGWTEGHPTSSMRLAQWSVAAPAEGQAAVDCVVFFFGAGGGGAVEANLERWKGQFEIEGTPAQTTEEVAPGLKATFLTLNGHYKASMQPGSGAAQDHPDWSLLSAVMEFQGGPLFLKCVGPKAVLAQAAPAFRAWVRSFRLAG